ncbi:MAG: hypothetical protein IAE80_16535 [Anaerolinea sp.]|nr:hypothetical protein [Anaerolinea sp.]
MVALPRILTVDPSGDVARLVRSAIDLAERPVIHVDAPTGADAWEELTRGGYVLLVAALALDNGINGIDLALRTRQRSPETALVLIGDEDEINLLDEASLQGAPFLLFQRPFDPQQFLRVVLAGIEERDIFAAYLPPALKSADADLDLGALPQLDMKAAQQLIDSLLTDVGAKSILLASRAGEILLERGALGYLNRDQLALSLAPFVKTMMQMSRLVGGTQVSALQFFDGETYDVFVLSVGYHYFLCFAFDGNAGNRYFGAVNRFGRRTAEDMITTLLGKSAYTFQAPAPPVEEKSRRRKAKTIEVPVVVVEEPEEIQPLVEKAEQWGDPAPAPVEPEPLRLEPIADFDPNIFDSSQVDFSLADDLFDPDKLAELARESKHERGPLSYEEAHELGIIP